MRGGRRASATGSASTAVNGDVNAPIEVTYTEEYHGLSVMPLESACQDPHAVFDLVEIDRFCGREWLTEQVDRFLDNHRCGYVWVEAAAGLGKTTFAARLVHQRGYLSHFTCLNGGDTTACALRNLSAQLVQTYGLEEYVPGGMLPPWAETPAGFERLLGRAANHARQRDERIVLVVDGLDEAEPTEQGLPLGLPALLPEGVFVIATYRTGCRPAEPRAPATTLVISADDERNRDDIQRYLANVITEEAIATPLARKGIDPHGFAENLAHRCGGVWVYLRYVLAEIRSGTRNVDRLGNLPSGLLGYYLNHLCAWQEAETEKKKVLLPLLATLAAVGEPMTAKALAALAAVPDITRVRQFCDREFRPFLTVQSGNARRYAIYHASLREFLGGHLPGTVDEHHSPDSHRAAKEVFQEARSAAHNAICDYYLDYFGGLDDGLPKLAADPDLALLHDGYPLRHLAFHLEQAGRISELDRLLAIQETKDPLTWGGLWFRTHDRCGTLDRYRHDLELARRHAGQEVDAAAARGELGPGFGREFRYALMLGRLHTYNAGISIPMLTQLVETGMWTPQRALAFARTVTDGGTRARGLEALVPLVVGTEQFGEILGTTRTIPYAEDRARVLVALAARLPQNLVAKALDAAIALPDEDRARVLVALAARLPQNLVAKALDAAVRGLPDGEASPRTLEVLAPHLPRSLLAEALDAARELPDHGDRARVLAAVASPCTDEERHRLLTKAVETAFALRCEEERVQAVVAVVPHLAEKLLARAVNGAHAVAATWHRARLFTRMAPHLPPKLLSEVIDSVRTSNNAWYRARVLAAAALSIPEGSQRCRLLAEALEAIAAVPVDVLRFQVLAQVAPHLPEELFDQALTVAHAITDLRCRAATVAALAPRFTADRHRRAVTRLLGLVRVLSSCEDRAEILKTLAPHLTDEEAARAFDVVHAVTCRDCRSLRLLETLAPRLSAMRVEQALEAAQTVVEHRERAGLLVALADRCRGHRQREILGQALEAARVFTGHEHHARVLARLTPRLSAAQVAQTLDKALAVPEEEDQAQLLTTLASRYTAEQCVRVFEAALAMSGYTYRTKVLAVLAPQLPEESRGRALAGILDVADIPVDRNCRDEAVAATAPYLSSGQLAEAFETARTAPDNQDQVRLLTALLPSLSPDQHAETYRVACAVKCDEHRARLLAALAPYLSDEKRDQAVAEALRVAASWAVASLDRVRILTALATSLSGHRLDKAVRIAFARAVVPWEQVRILTALVPCLSLDQLAEAFKIAQTAPVDEDRGRLLEALAQRLPPDRLVETMRTACIAGTDDEHRAQLVVTLAPCVAERELRQALELVGVISDPESRVRAFTALVSHLPDGLLPEASGLLSAVAGERHRAEMAAALAVRYVRGAVIRPESPAGGLLPDLVRVLRASIAYQPIEEVLKLAELFAPVVLATGEEETIRSYADAVCDSGYQGQP